jgi:predicted nucleotidyltransferase
MTALRVPRQQLLDGAAAIAERFALDDRVLLVYVFGSACETTRPDPGDLDLAILTRDRLGLEDLMRLRADVALETRLPVDLLSLNDAPVLLAREVVDSGLCLFARTDDAQTEFVTRTLARYWDFAPYLHEQWRLAGKRVAERVRGT